MRILMTGSRSFTDASTAEAALGTTLTLFDAAPEKTTLVHGAASRGADPVVSQTASKMGFELEAHPADWSTHGREAGFRRNELMVSLGADAVIAFPMHRRGTKKTTTQRDVSSGTWHCADEAKAAGLAVLVVWNSQLFAYTAAAETLISGKSTPLRRR